LLRLRNKINRDADVPNRRDRLDIPLRPVLQIGVVGHRSLPEDNLERLERALAGVMRAIAEEVDATLLPSDGSGRSRPPIIASAFS
jgi:hypothetical protein